MNRIKASVKACLILTLVNVLFNWRILFGHQFSVLLAYESANQAYCWFHFWTSAIRHGTWPVWDPFTFSGHAFAGEMQTGAFYPLYLLFLLVPFHNGLFSPGLYHIFVVATHILCAFFMYLLARELGLSFFAAIIGGICFSLGGVMVHLPGWPHLLESGIWLPLIFLFLIRALRTRDGRTATAYAALGGVSLAMSILAGGLHFVMLEALASTSLVVCWELQKNEKTGEWRGEWRRAAAALATFLIVGLAGGAVQLLPSAEYSRYAIRFLGNTALPAGQKIPYHYLSDGISAHSIATLLFSTLPGSVSGEFMNPYFGVFPLMLAGAAVWRRHGEFWVRYLAGMVLAAFLYSLGGFSLLHGLLYAFTPWLWLAREPGRALYLADFSLAILAAYGVEDMFQRQSGSWEPVNRVLRWVLGACAAAVGYYVLLGHGDFNPWTSFSILLIFLSYGLFRYIISGRTGKSARWLAVGLILFDLYAFDWSAANVLQEQAKKTDELSRLLEARPAAEFLRAQGGLFRVEVAANSAPNLGDLYGIQTTMGSGVTLVQDYNRFRGHSDLLGVRYTIRPAAAQEPGPVYQDPNWKVYENKQAYPRAWVVHNTIVERDSDKLFTKLEDVSVDLRKTALLSAPLRRALDPLPEKGAADQVDIRQYRADQMDLTVRTEARGLVVLSENFYPGWKAWVNEKPVPISKVDGELRGVVVPAGESRIRMSYAPLSVRLGFVLSAAAFASTSLLAVAVFRRRGKTHAASAMPSGVC